MLSFVAFYWQCVLVMKLSGYERGIVFDNYGYPAIVCLINFLAILTLLTQLTPWFERVTRFKLEEDADL